MNTQRPKILTKPFFNTTDDELCNEKSIVPGFQAEVIFQ